MATVIPASSGSHGRLSNSLFLVVLFLVEVAGQPCDPKLDYHVYYNGSALFTVSSSNGTCYCDSFIATGSGASGTSLSATDGHTILSRLTVQQLATFESGLNVTTGPSSFRGVTSFAGPVTALNAVSVANLTVLGPVRANGRAALVGIDLTGSLISSSSGLFSQITVTGPLSSQATTVTTLNATGPVTANLGLSVGRNATVSGAVIASSVIADGSRLTNLKAQPDIAAMNASLSSALQTISSLSSQVASLSAQASSLSSQVSTLTSKLRGQTAMADLATNQLCSLENFNYINNITILNNTLVTLGGGWGPLVLGGLEATTIVEYYSPLCNTWRTGPPSLTMHKYAGVVVYRGEVWVMGGFDNYFFVGGVQKFNPLTATWTQMPSLLHARQAPGAAVVNGSIYVIGGRLTQTTGFSKWNEKWNGTGQWYDMALMPTARRGCVAVAVNDLIYVLGGGTSTAPSAANEIYNPATDRWSYALQMPSPRNGHAGVFYNGQIWVIGGDDGANVVTTVFVYNISSSAWSIGPSLNIGRSQFCAGVVNGRVVACGGASNPSQWLPLKTCEMFDPVTESWVLTADMPTGRIACSAAGLGPY